MKQTKNYRPADTQTLTPQLVVSDARKYADALVKIFGGEKLAEYPNADGKGVMFAVVRIGESKLFLSDAGGFAKPTTSNLFLYVPDVDATVAALKDHGAKILSAPADMFWGDRWALVEDPEGNHWQVATHLEAVDPKEVQRRMQASA